ncbi:methyltransferase [Streptomyces spectabilis]|uniref:Methyltransferase domain-containing protein n=1 Tax=Streptomyces spectabilis TaxID=68270 RepID=A0A7W8B4E1_STRST|nr:methyltransferase [Streptomyces spectabilis]MBB5110116.1 hypothetical protein [Streptomyces spectabilis]GGV58704.1 hydroxyindole O-methyltransferase [Streptomyces spectabilis]
MTERTKKLMLSDRELKDFWLIRDGYHFFQAMAAACEFDLFTFLSRNPKSSQEQIHKHLGITPYATRALLFALATARLVEREEGGERPVYRNSKAAEKFLSHDSQYCMVPIVRRARQVYYRPMFFLYESLKTGRHVGLDDVPGKGNTIYEKLSQNPEQEKIFHQAMDATSTFFNPHLAVVEELKQVRHLVDLGGGDATNAIKLAQLFPDLRVTVYELPTVCAKADSNIARHKMEDRVRSFAGDFFKDPFPEGIDAVFMSHVNVIWSEVRNIELLRRCCEALPSKGKVICYNLTANDTETDPPGAAGMTLFFLALASGNGMAWPHRAYIEWFEQCGLTHTRTYRVKEPYDHAIIVGQK